MNLQHQQHHDEHEDTSQPLDDSGNDNDGNSDDRLQTRDVGNTSTGAGSEGSLLSNTLTPLEPPNTPLPTSHSQRSIEKAITQKFATLGMPHGDIHGGPGWIVSCSMKVSGQATQLSVSSMPVAHTT